MIKVRDFTLIFTSFAYNIYINDTLLHIFIHIEMMKLLL